MADSLHMNLRVVRDEILTSLARFEFQMRDGTVNMNINAIPETKNNHELEALRAEARNNNAILTTLVKEVQTLSQKVLELQSEREESRAILSIQPDVTSKNILVRTPALEAAVASINSVAAIEPLTLDEVSDEDEEDVEEAQDADDADNEQEEEEEEREVVEAEEEQGEEEEEQGEEEGEVVEAEEEQVEEEEEKGEEEGEVVEAEEEQVEEEEEEGGIEVEEFEYRGTTYQRDAEGTVYLEGDEIGVWNGKRIVFHQTTV